MDHGDIHLTALVGTPSMVLYGPATTEQSFPLNRQAEITPIQLRPDYTAEEQREAWSAEQCMGESHDTGPSMHDHIREVLLKAWG